MDFYAAASQIIPVLFVILAFESRSLIKMPASYVRGDEKKPRYWNATQIVGRIYLSVMLAIGEACALFGLYEGDESRLLDALIWLALIAGLLGATVQPVGRQWNYFQAWRRDGGGPIWFVVLFLLLVSFLAALIIQLFLR